MEPRARELGLGSAVARRVFLLFLASALLPVSVLGVFAWVRSSQELERAAREQLHVDAKREGMALLSRMLVAQGVLADAGAGAPAAAWDASSLPGNPFASVATVPASDAPGGAPTAAERDQLSRGGALIRTSNPGRVFLLKPAAQAEQLVVAELARGYLWTFERGDDSAGMIVVDERGAIVFSSLSPEATKLALAAQGAAHAGSPQIVEPWLLFLGGHFAPTSWQILRSELREMTLAPLAHFRVIFGWSALLALFVVGAFSSIQIRQTLGPLRRLTHAAQRLGDGDLGARAGVQERNEFGALAATFDRMAARIQRSVRSLESASELGRALGGESDEAKLIALLLRALVEGGNVHGAAFLREAADGTLVVESRAGAWEGISPRVAEALRAQSVVQHEGVNAEIVLPVRDHHGRLIALLQVCGPRGDAGDPLPRFREAEVAVLQSLATQASTALANRALVHEFRTLFEGLIELTIAALDAKSAYTAGHCRRVPILAEMLTDAVCSTREGAFAGFSFTAEQRYELRIAALLHDFGKIVTPVHVMDKSTKLETIHDRIELVATRYAVIEREAEVAWLRGRLRAVETSDAEWPGLPELAEELAFLRLHNRGSERQDREVRERLLEIARTRRWRALDGVDRPVLGDDEVENLTIERGTLTARERSIIEDHADQTIRLLAELPFPPHLKGVPHIAGSHHERVCGGGYPRGLRGDEITLQGRILGIADVFEALTAPDRPYREPMSVSSALETIDDMVKRGFLDADVFDVFLREGVYLRYAREQLRPEQLDDATLEALARQPGGPLPLA